MKYRSWIELVLAILLIACCGWYVFAAPPTFDSTGNPDDNNAGTTVEYLAEYNTLSYQDTEGTQMATVEPTDINYTVTAEYGFSYEDDSMKDLSVSPGDIVDHYFLVTMEGNATDNNCSWEAVFYEYAGAANWIVEKHVGEVSTFLNTLEVGVIHGTSGSPLPEDVHANFFLKVYVPSSESDAPNGSYIIILSTLETTSTPVGKYTGGNELTYGGTNEVSDSATDQVSAPVLTLTRTSTVDAPTSYTGGAHDAVPGAIITFTMEYSNIGASDARQVVLIDKIPDNTKLAHINTTGSTTNVNISAPQGTADGWLVMYSTIDSPSRDFGDYTGWNYIKAPDKATFDHTESFPGGGTTWVTGDVTYEAKWIKYQKNTVVTTEDAKTLTWGVTIR